MSQMSLRSSLDMQTHLRFCPLHQHHHHHHLTSAQNSECNNPPHLENIHVFVISGQKPKLSPNSSRISQIRAKISPFTPPTLPLPMLVMPLAFLSQTFTRLLLVWPQLAFLHFKEQGRRSARPSLTIKPEEDYGGNHRANPLTTIVLNPF